MPVDLQIKQESGWLRNNPADPVLVMDFVNRDNGKILFSYVARHEDLLIWVEYFTKLEEYECQKNQKKQQNQ